MLINIIKNSLKFTTYGSINITTGFNNGTITVFVKDTGCGIDQQNLPRLLKKFDKLERTAKLNNNGFGLGLTIVKNIVQLGEGQITVHSQGIGYGSLFAFDMKMQELSGLSFDESSDFYPPTFEQHSSLVDTQKGELLLRASPRRQ